MEDNRKELSDLLETLEKGKKLFEALDKINETKEETLEKFKISEIATFVETNIKKYDEFITSPKIFDSVMKSIIELVNYVYNEELIVTKVISRKGNEEDIQYYGKVRQFKIFTVNFTSEVVNKEVVNKEVADTSTSKEEDIKEFLDGLLNFLN